MHITRMAVLALIGACAGFVCGFLAFGLHRTSTHDVSLDAEKLAKRRLRAERNRGRPRGVRATDYGLRDPRKGGERE